jgi:murein DD-endopeptidase MepM/ murein hydrolase activator NlpD
MISAHQENRVVLGVKISEIEATIAGINEMKERLLAQREQLGQLRSDKETVMAAIENDKELFIRQAQELEQENKRIAASIRAKSTSASGYKGKPWSGSFIKPCKGEITSGFGYRVHPIFGVRKMHTGVDIGGSKGTAIHAAGDGKVIETGWGGGYGNMVIIDHGKGRSTLYGHMSRITCNTGDVVKAGDKIGEMGSTGYATGNHLHFEVRINGDPVNPLKAL